MQAKLPLYAGILIVHRGSWSCPATLHAVVVWLSCCCITIWLYCCRNTLLQLSELLSEVSLSKQPGLQAAAEALVGHLHKALAGIPARVLAGDAEQGLAALISSWGLEPQVR
jgi:hypothetical protein